MQQTQAASDARAAAQAGLQAGKELAAAGQEAMRKAGGQAAELWRASLDPLSNLNAEFGRWFEQMWRQGLSARLLSAPPIGQSMLAALSGSPNADLYETENAAELVMELPGLTAKDVHLAVKGDALTVSGERTEETTPRGRRLSGARTAIRPFRTDLRHAERGRSRPHRGPLRQGRADGDHAAQRRARGGGPAHPDQGLVHARSTKLSITFFSPALSKATVSLLPSTALTRP